MRFRIAGITRESIVDGPGIRVVIWGQGCIHHCPGCHNEHSQDPHGGDEITLEDVFKEIDQSFLAQGITLSGGDPFFQPEAFKEIAKHAKAKEMSVWAFTGYTWEALLVLKENNLHIKELLENIDVIVDGPFILAQKELDLVFRGSANQRLIDVPKSLEKSRAVIIPDQLFRP